MVILFVAWLLFVLPLISADGVDHPMPVFPDSPTQKSATTCDAAAERLPSKLIVGYANWNQCDDKIVEAVQSGVNVVIWFSINLAVDEMGRPVITNGPDWDCVAEKVARIRELGIHTIHLISIGGWNSPHPDASSPVEETYAHWVKWNREIIARPERGFFGFDGFDWDIEGNDDVDSRYNEFSPMTLDFMGRFSQMAKRDGYIVAMAPAESYLDPVTAPSFDLSLRHEHDEWKAILPAPFPYHGRNCYAYLLARYGTTTTFNAGDVDTFDFITVQLYEGYSHMQFAVTINRVPPSDALRQFCKSITTDWQVDFSTALDLDFPEKRSITVPSTRLVVGLANGWAGDGKFLFLSSEDIRAAYESLAADESAPRGFAFWNILDEGRCSPQQPDKKVYLAKELNTFMHTR